MIWCRFEDAGHPVYGLIEDEWVTAVSGGPFGHYEKSDRRMPLSVMTMNSLASELVHH